MGISKSTANGIFLLDKFPASKFGKNYLVEASALKKFFEVSRIEK